MSSLNSCSNLHSTINEKSLHDQLASSMNIDHSNSIHDQSSSSMNIDHSNNSNSCYTFDFELYNIESFKFVPYDKLIHNKSFKGLLFDSLDIGLDFYKTYGQESSFDVNMSSQKRYNDGTICIRYSTCSKSGFTESFKNENINRRRTSSKKNGCLAVSKFKNLRCSLMTMDFLDESFIHKVSTCNIGASKAYDLVTSIKGGFNSRGGTIVDFKNFHRDLNSKIGVKDSQMVVDILTNRKLCFSNFSFEVQKDVNDHLTGLFWADDTSKANYKEFGDVLSFDVFYAFVLFTGVDYHKRCVTFAADLLAHETVDANVWLLEVFRKAFVKLPMMIVTYQDSSMKKAVNFVFPESKHRLCMWHITQKLEEKIPIDVYNHPDFQKTFFDIILNLQCSPQDFEISIMLSHIFWHHKSNLVKFVMSFDSAMEKQKHHHSLLDYQSTTTTPTLMTPLAIEKRKELYKFVFYCVQESVVIEDESEIYVLRDKKKKKLIDKNVNEDEDSDDFYRNSLLIVLILISMEYVVFSRMGDSISISCRRIVMLSDVFHIKYERGKDIIADGLMRKKYSYPHKGSKNECLIQDAYVVLRLSINKIENNEDELAKYIKQLQEVDSGIPLCPSSRASSSILVHIEKIIGAAVPDVINIHNPQGIRNKGWASDKVIKSTREKVIETSKKGSRLCSLCHKPNHNARSCILRLKKSYLESESINTYIYNFQNMKTLMSENKQKC
uniref:Protein FAR1-RELATED SEQUENCE n=1 Tax=Lactuca sativa TaxID=4236 RepID=A0A9R1XI44_LACSA|nr:hypothetical protein LSAT_V11C400184990 [Lactuca sativa]